VIRRFGIEMANYAFGLMGGREIRRFHEGRLRGGLA